MSMTADERRDRIKEIQALVATLDPPATPDELDPSILVVRSARTGVVTYESTVDRVERDRERAAAFLAEVLPAVDRAAAPRQRL